MRIGVINFESVGVSCRDGREGECCEILVVSKSKRLRWRNGYKDKDCTSRFTMKL